MAKWFRGEQARGANVYIVPACVMLKYAGDYHN